MIALPEPGGYFVEGDDLVEFDVTVQRGLDGRVKSSGVDQQMTWDTMRRFLPSWECVPPWL
jgi:hypothetical protein